MATTSSLITMASPSLLERRRALGRAVPAIPVVSEAHGNNGRPATSAMHTSEDLTNDDHFSEEADELFAEAVSAMQQRDRPAPRASTDWVQHELDCFLHDLPVHSEPTGASSLPPSPATSRAAAGNPCP
jgi:hypothetical protein